MNNRTPVCAVLTGDIAASSSLPEALRGRIPAVIGEISDEVQRRYPAAVSHPIELFRGDSWQLLTTDPAVALRIAVSVRAQLRAAFGESRVDTRVAIGFGTVDFIPEDGVSGGDGTAFRRSGEALDTMGRGFRMAVEASDSLGASTAPLLDAVAKLIDLKATDWTRRQAFAVARAMAGLTQEEIGEQWLDQPVSQQTVGQHLVAAGWNAVDLALAKTEASIRSAQRKPRRSTKTG